MHIDKNILFKLLSILTTIGIIVAVFGLGGATFTAMQSTLTPRSGAGMVIDYVSEVKIMKSALNAALPIGVFSLIAEVILESLKKRFNFALLAVSLSAMISISLCAMMFFQFFIYIHGGEVTWQNDIWWAF